MSRASISDLKARLSYYLREVARGGEVEILDRGVPVARLSAISPSATPDMDDRRERLIRAGVLRQGESRSGEILSRAPLEVSSSILEALEEERSDRL